MLFLNVILKILTKNHGETFRNPTQASNKFDLSILHPKFDSIFPQMGFPVHTFAYSGAENEGQIDIRYPVSAIGSFEYQRDNKLPQMFVNSLIYLYKQKNYCFRNFERITLTDPDRNCIQYRPGK